MAQQTVDISKKYSLEEYIQIDETAMQRHEYHYGKLVPLPGDTLLENEMCLTLFIILHTSMAKWGFNIFVENVKVKIEGEDIYVYPDVVVMKEQPSESLPHKDYIIYNPLLVVEVLSDSTRKFDLTDKFIQYQKIASLQYYLAVEPQKQLAIFTKKTTPISGLPKHTLHWMKQYHYQSLTLLLPLAIFIVQGV